MSNVISCHWVTGCFCDNLGTITFLCSLNKDIGKQLDAFEIKFKIIFLDRTSQLFSNVRI